MLNHSTVNPCHHIASDLRNIIPATVSGSLSMIGALFIIGTYFVWRDIQTTSRRILVYISIADFFAALSNIVGILSPRNEAVCLVQSTIGTFFILCSFFWTVFLAVYLFIGCTRKNLYLAERLMGVFHVIGWGVPCIIVCVASTTGKLGYSGDVVSSGWCWVNGRLSRRNQIKWMLIAGKFWEVSAFVIITVLYILIRREMRKELHNAENLLLSERSTKAAQAAERKLIMVPLLFMALRIWGTIRFFIFIRDGHSDIVWLIILQGIGDNAPGFFNFLIFCFFTEKVLRQIRRATNGCCYRLCPGMITSQCCRTSSQNKIDSRICNPSSSSPDYQTFGKTDEELYYSSTTNP